MKSVTLKTSHIVIIAAVLVMLIGVGTYFIVSKTTANNSGSNQPVGGVGFRFDEGAKEYTGREPEDRGGTPRIT